MDIISFSKIKKLAGQAEMKTNKGAPNGYASLDGTGNVPANQLANASGGGGGVKNNYNATADPTMNDDSGDGYSVGSTWINITDDKAFVCLDASVGAATWEQISGLATHKADYASKFPDSARAHNSIYRGKYLGSSVTSEQYAAIAAGTFVDLYIGDYWTIGGVNYRIAAFNYYYNSGDAPCTTNHVTIVPDTALYNAVMNSTDITTGAYVGSEMYTTHLASAKSTILAAFPGHVLTHRQLLVNNVTEGKASGVAWFDSQVELMNEVMVYGSIAWGESTVGGSGHNVGVCKSQLPLFAFAPDLISNGVTYWLRDVVSAANFVFVSSAGFAYNNSASSSAGVRPAFSIS